MTNDTTFEKIEAWLSGELPEAEARAFEAELADDDALAAEVERHRHGREALARLAEQSLQQDFALWRSSLDDVPPPPDTLPDVEKPAEKKTGWPRWLTIAALLLALAGTIWFLIPETTPPPVEDKKKEIVPPKQKPDIPVVEVTPPTQTGEPGKPDRPQQPRQPDTRRKPAEIAGRHLRDYQKTVLLQYGQTMGDEEEENPFFTAGLKALKSNDTVSAKQNLVRIPAGDAYFPPAQELLAVVYFQEKNYAEAARCYEHFARQSADPLTDWRLVQFYLADYDNRKADFWKKMDEILDPAHPHGSRESAEILKKELGRSGISNK